MEDLISKSGMDVPHHQCLVVVADAPIVPQNSKSMTSTTSMCLVVPTKSINPEVQGGKPG